VQNAKLLRPTNWSVYRQKRSLNHSLCESSSNYLKITYKTPVSDFTLLDFSTLSAWQEKRAKLKSSPYCNLFYVHPLNQLYDIIFKTKR